MYLNLSELIFKKYIFIVYVDYELINALISI